MRQTETLKTNVSRYITVAPASNGAKCLIESVPMNEAPVGRVLLGTNEAGLDLTVNKLFSTKRPCRPIVAR